MSGGHFSKGLVGCFGFNGPLRQYFSLYWDVSQREGERGKMRVKMSKQPPPAPTASAIGPCPTEIKIVGRPGTGSLPSTIAPPDHPLSKGKVGWLLVACFGLKGPFETVLKSISGRLPERGRKKREVIDERNNVQTTPTRPTASTVGPCPIVIQISTQLTNLRFKNVSKTSQKTLDNVFM